MDLVGPPTQSDISSFSLHDALPIFAGSLGVGSGPNPQASASQGARSLSHLRLRPPRHAGALPGMRDDSAAEGGEMKRRLFNLLALQWLLLWRGLAGLWIRSYSTSDY